MASEKETKKFVSDDGVSTAATPVTPEGGADAEIDPKKAKKDKSVKGIDEAFSSLLDQLDVTEDFKRQVIAIFETAVEAKSNALAEEIRAASAKELEEAVAELQTEMESAKTSITEGFETRITELTKEYTAESETVLEGVTSFLDYIAERYMEENALAIESTLAVERANRIAESVAHVAALAGLDLSEETVSMYSDLEETKERLESEYNDLMLENIKLKDRIQLQEREDAIESIGADLTESQKEQLTKLGSKLSFTNIETFREDVSAIKESMFKVSAKQGKDLIERQEEAGSVSVEGEIVERVEAINEVDAIVAAIKKLKR